ARRAEDPRPARRHSDGAGRIAAHRRRPGRRDLSDQLQQVRANSTMPAQDKPGRVSLLHLSICIAAALVTLASAAHAIDVPAEMREKLETCAACHGQNGVSPNQEVPSLAAQPDIFTQWQLVYMRDGTRKVEAMEEVVKGMTDSDIRFYGAYYAALPPPV